MQALSSKACDKFGNGFGLRLPVYTATIITWFLTGLWHGAGWNFIVWGLLNCLVILVSRELEPIYRRFYKRFPALSSSRTWGAWQAVRTFLLMGLIRSLDCYRNVGTTFSLWGSMLTRWNFGELFGQGLFSFGMSGFDLGVVVCAAVLAFFVSRLGKDEPLRYRLSKNGALWLACV